jgi:hypothetical protein
MKGYLLYIGTDFSTSGLMKNGVGYHLYLDRGI